METQKPNANNPLVEDMDVLAKAKENRKVIISSVVVFLVVVVIGFIIYLFNSNASKKADEAIALADIEVNDSLALDLYKQAAQMGHKSGNRAKLEVAIAYYNDKKYQEAIDYLKDASSSSEIVEAGRYSLMGDCYVNLDNLNEALACYGKAIKAAKNNPQIVPFVLVKEANIYREQQNYQSEYAAYQRILNEFPSYVNTHSQIDIKKFAARAKASAEAK